MSSKLKEVFIILLLFVVIVFTIGVLFYDCIPQGGTSLETKEYLADKEVKKVLNEIEETTGGVEATDDKKDSLIKSYSIGKDDLTEFATENYYESGKKDPFAEYSTPVEEEVVKTITITNEDVNNIKTNNEIQDSKNTISNKTSNTTSNIVINTVKNEVETQNTTKEEIKESSTGSYFEKKNSK